MRAESPRRAGSLLYESVQNACIPAMSRRTKYWGVPIPASWRSSRPRIESARIDFSGSALPNRNQSMIRRRMDSRFASNSADATGLDRQILLKMMSADSTSLGGQICRNSIPIQYLSCERYGRKAVGVRSISAVT